MCGIAGVCHLHHQRVPDLAPSLAAMNQLQKHRGPDGQGTWTHRAAARGLGHRRLSIIDLDAVAISRCQTRAGNWVTYNGEIYNYLELREELGRDSFRTTSDTEVILAAYRRWGADCVDHFRGMFAFALWDEARRRRSSARATASASSRFYYTQVAATFSTSRPRSRRSCPFLPAIETDRECAQGVPGVPVLPRRADAVQGYLRAAARPRADASATAASQTRRYWEVYYDLDFDHTARVFRGALCASSLEESVAAPPSQRRADRRVRQRRPRLEHRRGHSRRGSDRTAWSGSRAAFDDGPEYDESRLRARSLAEQRPRAARRRQLTPQDFRREHPQSVIYHLDYPVGGAGLVPAVHGARLAARHRKVVLGGQGGDEIFGGYARYLIAYFEQCIKAAIDGTIERTATSSSPTSRSSPTSTALARSTSRCCRSSGGKGCSTTSTGATSA